MKIPKSKRPKGSKVQPGKSVEIDNLESRWLRRWEDWLEKNDTRMLYLVRTVPQVRIAYEENYRWDFAVSANGRDIAIEIQGGQHMDKSGHTNWNGQNRDALKTRLAAAAGWTQITFTSDDIAKNRGFDDLGRALGIVF